MVKSICKGFPQNLVAQATGQATTEEREANARLIAAAPDLLAALEKIEYASRKDSLTDHERIQSVRTIVCMPIRLTPTDTHASILPLKRGERR